MDVFTINGTDITPYIAERGVKWSRNDINGQNAGVMLDGSTTRDRLATKITLDVTFIAADTVTLSPILALFDAEYFEVTYDDPLYGQRTMEAYTDGTPASLFIRRTADDTFWDGVTVSITER